VNGRVAPNSLRSSTGPETARIAEVWAPGDNGGMRGSGYLLDGELVLTAGHVVDRAAARGCEVRPLGATKWVRSEVVWRGAHCDAALLRVRHPVKGVAARVRLGRFGTDQRADVRAVGFPEAQAKVLGHLSIVDTEDVFAQVALLSGIKTGTLTLHVAGSTPAAGRRAKELWGGMSGAALFGGPLLVGLIIRAPGSFGSDRLEAVPVEAMAGEAGFRAAMTGDRDLPPSLEVVEEVELTRGLLRPPYRPLPDQATPEALRDGAFGFLLEPDYGVVPFHGREQELDEHARWCRGRAGVAVRLVTGAPGAGKTRFAAELCRRQLAEGGVAGFLDANGQTERLAGLAEVGSPLLVVVDEAQSRLGEVAQLLASLASADRRQRRPARILLLSREAGDWWPGAIEQRLDTDPDGRLALATATLRKLAPLDDESGRERSFLAAAAAFAERLGETASVPVAPALPAAVFGEVLMVHLAALSAVTGDGESIQATDIADELLAFVLRGEARYWASTARSHELGLEQPVLRAAVALATLTSASSLEEAAALLRAVPDLRDAPELTVRRAARWLRELYPVPAASAVSDPGTGASSAWFRPLGPALLAEALVASVLAAEQTPELAEMVLSRVQSPGGVHRALTVLNQTARRYESARDALERALRTHVRSVWQPVVVVAAETGDPIGQLLARALEAANEPALGAEISGQLPIESVALRELALVAARQLLEASRNNASDDQDAELLSAASNLASRLVDVGALQEALDTVEGAIKTARRVADGREDLLPQLAMALATESACLEALGRLSETVSPADEAVTIYRTLRQHEPGMFTFELASALANQAAFRAAGNVEDALASNVESLHLFGKLVADEAANPAGPRHDPIHIAARIALLAVTRAQILSRLGRGHDALQASKLAVSGFRQLSDLNPDAFLPRLAEALNSHSARLLELRRTDESRTALDEAIRINRVLAAARSDVFAVNLARNLCNLAKRLRDMGRGQEAMVRLREAIAIYRDASARQRGTATALLAGALSDQSGLFARAGRRQAAFEAIDEAVGLLRGLAAEMPDDHEPELANALSTAAGRLMELGQPGGALELINEATGLYRRLVGSGRGIFESELGMVLGNRASALQHLGQNDQALESITEAIEIYSRLTEHGDDREDSARLAEGLRVQGRLLHALGRTREALESTELAAERFRVLASRRGGGSADGLARSLTQQALYLSLEGDHDRASALGGEAVRIFKSQVKASGDPAMRIELGAALVNQAEALSAVGQERAALSAITEAVAAFRELGPSHADLLATSLEAQFKVLSKLGRHEQAVEAMAEAVQLRRVDDLEPGFKQAVTDTGRLPRSQARRRRPDRPRPASHRARRAWPAGELGGRATPSPHPGLAARSRSAPGNDPGG
jgi:tetratricopeptide (TPR) repeat protein